MNDSWESEIGGLLAELADVQSALLGDAAREAADAGERAITQALAAMAGREQQLVERLQACHERRQQLLARAEAEGLPADSIRSLSDRLPAESRGRVQASIREAAERSRLLAASEPHQLGASAANAATSFAVDRDYCYRRAAAADIW